MACVFLSVRPSVTNRSSAKMATCRITQTTSYDSPEQLVFFSYAADLAEIRLRSPPTAVSDTGVVG